MSSWGDKAAIAWAAIIVSALVYKCAFVEEPKYIAPKPIPPYSMMPDGTMRASNGVIVPYVPDKKPMPSPLELDPIIYTAKDNSVVFLDSSTVTPSRTARMAWVYDDLSKVTTTPFRSSKTLYRVNCDTTHYEILEQIHYLPDGKSGRSQAADNGSGYYPPETNGAATVAEICKPRFDKK